MKRIIPILLFCSIHLYGQTVDSLRFKVGQLIIVGFRGMEVTDTSQIIRDIKNQIVGGVILFDYDVPTKQFERNISSPSQLKSLIASLKENSTTPLFISIDQEGGRVNRLKPKYGFPSTQSAEALGKTTPSISEQEATTVAITLQGLGINTNFAPDVDVNVNPKNPIIGKIGRSFSANADEVYTKSLVVTKSLRAKGILNCIKHFPGHGSSTGDTHLDFVDVTETWKQEELVPFAKHIASKSCDMIMIAHVVHKQLDSIYPASLSKNIIDSLLRKKMNYQGVIITDDLQMKAIQKYYDLKTTIKLTMLAGTDLLIFSNNGDTYRSGLAQDVFNTLLDLVRTGDIPIARINEAYQRVMVLKRKLK